MGNLKEHSKVEIEGGGTAEILDEFGSGGQGTVYKVSYRGREYALKWYHKDGFHGKEKEFYDNIRNNIVNGAPTGSFLWPKYITRMYDKQFGYLMDIRPSGYAELTEFFVGSKTRKQKHFKSFHAVSNAAINIIEAFRALHAKGYSYQDINNGNFFINPENGDVLICDNDNVSPDKVNLGIMGKQRWMAPEIVLGENEPDKNSDRFSLAVVLFRLLFINHPLEGRYSTPPCMTWELERKFYGSDPIFVYDPHDDRNRPIPGTDQNLRQLWNAYPEYIRDSFCKAFSQDAMKKKNTRLTEKVWLDQFIRLRAEIGECPHCYKETFYAAKKQVKCIECGKMIPVAHTIKIRQTDYPIFKGMQIAMWEIDNSLEDTQTQVAETIENKSKPGLLGIRNMGKKIWRVYTSETEHRSVNPGQVVPVHAGYTIDFDGSSGTYTGKID